MSATLIDSHQHFWDPALGSYPWMTESLSAIRRPFGPDDLEPLLEQGDVRLTIAVQARSDLDETRWLLGLADANPFVAGVVGWVDLVRGDAAGQIDALRSETGGAKLVGVRHPVHDEPDPQWLLRPDVIRGLRAVAQASLAYDLLVRARELPAAFQVARSLPELEFVVDHLAKPPLPAEWSDAWLVWMSQLAGLPNVSVKLSGLVTEANWDAWKTSDFQSCVQKAIELFGPERLLFGSDWPVCLLAAEYGQVLDLAGELLVSLSDAERRMVFHENALRLYGA